MEVALNANMYDSSTSSVANVLRKPLDELSELLKGEYGGDMEHLWIDLELVEHFSKTDGKQRWPFRFQKRVSGRSRFGLPPMPDKYNVGHYSVRPNFEYITSQPIEQVILYVLSLIYESTTILKEKQEKLGGFNADLFRVKFFEGCRAIGYEISNKSL